MKRNRLFLLLISFLVLQMSYAQNQDDETNKWVLLTNTNNLPSSNGHLLTIPEMGLYYADNGNLFALDTVKCQGKAQIRFLENFQFDQLIVNDGTFLVKSHQFVLQIGSDNPKILAELDTGNFYLFSGYGGKYNLVVQEDSTMWAWYRCDSKSPTTECVVRAHEPILKILDREGTNLCIIGESLYMVTENNLMLLSKAEEPLRDMVLTDMGCLLCTDRNLYLVNSEMQASVIATGKFHSLYYDNGTLYVVLQNGDIMKTEI